jgi:hypothetical protein
MRTVIDFKLLVIRFIGWFLVVSCVLANILQRINAPHFFAYILLAVGVGAGGWAAYNSIVRITPEKVSWGAIFGIVPGSVATNEIESYSIDQKTEVQEYQSGGERKFLFKRRYIVELVGKFGAKKISFTSYNAARRLISHIQGVMR